MEKIKKINDYIVYDLETGGLSPEKHAIVQIGMIAIAGDTLEEIERYTTYCKPYHPDLTYEDKALEINKATMKDINGGKDIKVVVGEMIAFFERHKVGNFKKRPIMVGHNIDEFDTTFLRLYFDLVDEDLMKYISPTTMDTLKLAHAKWQHLPDIGKYNLRAACEKAGVDLIDAHGAMTDTEATTNLFRYFLNCMRGGTAANSPSGNIEVKPRFEF